VLNRKEEVLHVLKKLKRKRKLDLVFLNLIDIKNGKTYFVCVDEKTLDFIKEKTKSREINRDVLVYKKLILRKELEVLLGLELVKN